MTRFELSAAPEACDPCIRNRYSDENVDSILAAKWLLSSAAEKVADTEGEVLYELTPQEAGKLLEPASLEAGRFYSAVSICGRKIAGDLCPSWLYDETTHQIISRHIGQQ